MVDLIESGPITQGRMMRTRTFATRDEWLKWHCTRLTASKLATALNANKWESRYKLWAVLTGRLPPDDLSDNEDVECGNLLEPVVKTLFERRTKREVTSWPQLDIVLAPGRDWLSCTPDAIQTSAEFNGPGVLEIKSTGERLAKEWIDEPPLPALIQANFQAWMMDLEWGSCACLVGRKLVRHDFQRNDRFLDVALPELDKFWQLVQTDTPPEPDASDSTSAAIKALHPDDNGETTQLSLEAEEWFECLSLATQCKKEAKEKEQLYDNKLRAAIGDSTFAVLPSGRLLSLKTTNKKSFVMPACKFRTLREVKGK